MQGPSPSPRHQSKGAAKALCVDEGDASSLDGSPIEDMDSLRAQVDRLRAENSRLRWSFAVKTSANNHLPKFVAVNWNLAGVNENPFEFMPATGVNFTRVPAFIDAMDALISSVLEDEHDHHGEPKAELDPFVAKLKLMKTGDLLSGLVVAGAEAEAKAASDVTGETPDADSAAAEEEAKRAAAIRRSSMKRTTTIAISELETAALNSGPCWDSVDLNPSEVALASQLKKQVEQTYGTIPLIDVLRRGTGSYFSSPDLVLKGRSWSLAHGGANVATFLQFCLDCFGSLDTDHQPVKSQGEWWKHWLRSAGQPASQH